MDTTGTVHKIQGEMKYEWEIEDFLMLEDLLKEGCWSPEFSLYGVSWEMWIEESDGYVGLFLDAVSLPKPVTMNASLSFKTVEGKSDPEETFTYYFDGKRGWEYTRFILMSELIQRKAELLPSGTLTVICTLKNSQSNSTGVSILQQHFNDIFHNGNFSDVVLKVEGQEFKCHRCVLSRSPVSLAMLTHDTKEKNTGVVDIQDADPKMFSDFLQYLYTGNEEIVTSENVVELYTAADKYRVDELKQSCLDYMLENITVDNFPDILNLSLVHVEKSLTDACSEFFIQNSLSILKTSKWLMFATKNPVAANELNIKYVENNTKIKN